MGPVVITRLRNASTLLWVVVLAICGNTAAASKPRLPTGVRMQDVRLHSTVLNRTMMYRIILPDDLPRDTKLPVVWLLHGVGDNHRSWSSKSGIARLAERGIILVMPDGNNSYYVNSATTSRKKYETYLISEVIPDVHRRFPAAATDREHNAIVGISRGGFGAIVLSLKHPELFSFVAGLSPVLDITERPFRWNELVTSIGILSTFGKMGNPARYINDPYLLLGAASTAPYFDLICGTRETLSEPTQRFAKLLEERGFSFELHLPAGGHDWTLWNAQLPALEESLLQHLGLEPEKVSQR